MPNQTWEKASGRYFCRAKECAQWTQNGCKLRKVGLTCDNGECEFNVSPMPGVYQCGCMDVHLDADGLCLGWMRKSHRFVKLDPAHVDLEPYRNKRLKRKLESGNKPLRVSYELKHKGDKLFFDAHGDVDAISFISKMIKYCLKEIC